MFLPLGVEPITWLVPLFRWHPDCLRRYVSMAVDKTYNVTISSEALVEASLRPNEYVDTGIDLPPCEHPFRYIDSQHFSSTRVWVRWYSARKDSKPDFHIYLKGDPGTHTYHTRIGKRI